MEPAGSHVTSVLIGTATATTAATLSIKSQPKPECHLTSLEKACYIDPIFINVKFSCDFINHI